MQSQCQLLHTKCRIRSCMNLKVAARALACERAAAAEAGERGGEERRGRILCKVINLGRFSPPPLITRSLLLYFVPFHKFGGKNSEFPLLRCSSPFGWRLRWREIGAGHFRRPLIRNFHQGVIRRQRGGVAEHLVRIGEGRREAWEGREGLSQFRRAD